MFQIGSSYPHPMKVVFVVAALCSQPKTISALLAKYSFAAPNEDVATDSRKKCLYRRFIRDNLLKKQTDKGKKKTGRRNIGTSE